MYSVIPGTDDIGDRLFVIFGCQRRSLVDMDKDQVRVSLVWSVGMMYISGSLISGCAVEAKSRSQQRMAEMSDRGRYLRSRKAGINEQSNLPP